MGGCGHRHATGLARAQRANTLASVHQGCPGDGEGQPVATLLPEYTELVKDQTKPRCSIEFALI